MYCLYCQVTGRMVMKMRLDNRKMQILRAIIDDYILNAVPVGSRTISKHPGIGLSSATIRNEMADLEELGYLEQPHLSAGRIPSDKAFRLYVDDLMSNADLNPEEIRAANNYLSMKRGGIEAVVRQTAIALSDLTDYTSMVLSPQLRGIRLRHIQIVPLRELTAIVIIVTDAGITKNAFIRTPYNMDAELLDRISRRLTAQLYDCRVVDIDTNKVMESLYEFGNNVDFFKALINGIESNLEEGSKHIELSGAGNILSHPEYNDVERAKHILSVIEEQESLYRVLRDATKMEFTITIGAENENPDMRGCSIVTATYHMKGKPIGSMGVIGPTRMNYAKVLAILRYMGSCLSETLTSMLEEDS